MGDLPEGVTHWDGPGLDAWRAWTPAEVAERLADVNVGWCVVGGWAIDVFLGTQTREHEDLEIAIKRADLPVVRRHLRQFVFHAVGDGEVRRLADGTPPPAEKHQNWVLDSEAEAWRVDVMLEPGDEHTWVYRRDESITAPRAFMVGTTDDGIPFLKPHGVLLYKAKSPRTKDEADFERAASRLSDPERTWLVDALGRVYGEHPWTVRLGSR